MFLLWIDKHFELNHRGDLLILFLTLYLVRQIEIYYLTISIDKLHIALFSIITSKHTDQIFLLVLFFQICNNRKTLYSQYFIKYLFQNYDFLICQIIRMLRQCRLHLPFGQHVYQFSIVEIVCLHAVKLWLARILILCLFNFWIFSKMKTMHLLISFYHLDEKS